MWREIWAASGVCCIMDARVIFRTRAGFCYREPGSVQWVHGDGITEDEGVRRDCCMLLEFKLGLI